MLLMDNFHRVNCSPSIIFSRGLEAKFKREVSRISKVHRRNEREFLHNERKIASTQRGIIGLLGNESYLDPGVKGNAVLYGQTIPGFCYRKNGEPRRPCPIYESNTTRIIHTLDGKQGIMNEPAANVLSDNPLMDEILSSPQILPILCDLRTTGLLRGNKNLLDKFVQGLTQLQLRKHIKILENDDPAVVLEKYRASLLKELFDELQIQAELRLNPGLIPAMPPDGTDVGYSSPLDGDSMNLNSETWRKTLITKLFQLAEEKGESSAEKRSNDSVSLSSTKQNKTGEPSSTLSTVSSANEATPKNRPLKIPNQHRKNSKETQDEMKQYQRMEYVKFIRGLIEEVENIVELSKIIRMIRRKNPCNVHCDIGILERLLKEDIFTTLNEEYCGLLQEQGKLTTSEHDRCLRSSHPTSTSNDDDTDSVDESNPNKEFTKSILDSYESMLDRIKALQLKSKNRFNCPACKAKLKQGCEIVRERDAKYQKQIDNSEKQRIGTRIKDIDRLSPPIGGLMSKTYHQSRNLVTKGKSQNDNIGPSSFFSVDTTPTLTPIPTIKRPSPNLSPPHNLAALVGAGTGIARIGSMGKGVAKSGTWTLKVSRMDLLKLRQELENNSFKEKTIKFTKHLQLQNAQSRRFEKISDFPSLN